jgi:hypothetical protein
VERRAAAWALFDPRSTAVQLGESGDEREAEAIVQALAEDVEREEIGP